MLSSTHEAIKKVVVCFFTLNQITEAKDMLYEIISKQVTVDKVHRRDSLLKSKADSHTTDILNVMSKMDRENIMPLFVGEYEHVGGYAQIQTGRDVQYQYV
jgi:F0F1-type ATP synthase delta subunit